MPHRVDIDSIHQNLFLLLNICYAAQAFAQNHDLESSDGLEIVDGQYYFGWLRFTLSDKLIDIAAKTRIILDMVRAEEESYRADGEKFSVDSRALDRKICDQYIIGFFIGADDPVTLRESCNKIIHALDIRPIFEKSDEDHVLDEESDDKRDWKYWKGILELRGQKGKDEWCFTLHLGQFCVALEELITQLEHEVDWHSMQGDDLF